MFMERPKRFADGKSIVEGVAKLKDVRDRVIPGRRSKGRCRLRKWETVRSMCISNKLLPVMSSYGKWPSEADRRALTLEMIGPGPEDRSTGATPADFVFMEAWAAEAHVGPRALAVKQPSLSTLQQWSK
jgi:hypothetical protein